MDQFLAYPLKEIPYVAITLMIAFTFHEFSHAYVAYKFGDMTAKNQGRLTLNPIQHLDPIGTLLIFVAGFGWARPVPVNRFFFKKPRLAGVLVSIAGPISNLILTAAALLILFVMKSAGVIQSVPTPIIEFFYLFIQLNTVLFIFNLLPLPPLDGYRVVEDLLPNDARAKLTQYETYGSVIFLILVLTPLSHYTIQPIFNYAVPWVLNILGFYHIFI